MTPRDETLLLVRLADLERRLDLLADAVCALAAAEAFKAKAAKKGKRK